MNTIIQVNKDPNRPYWLALNPYADLTPLEFRTKILSDLPYAEDPITQREAVTAKQAGLAEVVLDGKPERKPYAEPKREARRLVLRASPSQHSTRCHAGLEGSNDTSVQAVGLLRGYTVPARKPYVDWRNVNGKSYVTPIKDQGQVRKPIPSTRLRCIHLLVSLPLAAVRAQLASCAVAQCGSCTMFSACALLESYYHIKKNLAVTSTQVMDLSEQYFVNCVNSQARNTNTHTHTHLCGRGGVQVGGCPGRVDKQLVGTLVLLPPPLRLTCFLPSIPTSAPPRSLATARKDAVGG